jgi:hypothetical protein
MTSRAIHLELVTDRSTDTFLMAFRRFVSTRGQCKVCYSDNGGNFVGAQAYLKELFQNYDFNQIKRMLRDDFNTEFQWKWNIPLASHQNGVTESLIKSVRNALEAACKNVPMTEEQWRTALCEITYLVNSRPLYANSDDLETIPPITPNDLILGEHYSPPQPEPEDRINPEHLNRVVQGRVNEFWQKWMSAFAPQLLFNDKWPVEKRNLQPGDLVLEINPNTRRGQWKMAKVINVYPGQDKLVRKVRIRNRTSEYDRPCNKLCLIATSEELQGK